MINANFILVRSCVQMLLSSYLFDISRTSVTISDSFLWQAHISDTAQVEKASSLLPEEDRQILPFFSIQNHKEPVLSALGH